MLDDPGDADAASRAIAAGARRSRYSAALLAKYVTFGAHQIDGAAALEARSSLTKIQESLPSATVKLLLDAAIGEDHSEMAANLGISVPTLQTRLSRARATARKLVA